MGGLRTRQLQAALTRWANAKWVGNMSDVASGARHLFMWLGSAGPGPVLVFAGAILAAIITTAGVLINGARQRRHETTIEVSRTTREDREKLRDRLTPSIREMIQISDELERFASNVGNDPDAVIQDARRIIQDARRRLDLIAQPELVDTREELKTTNGLLVQWSGIVRGLRDDVHNDRPANDRLYKRADELEIRVRRNLAGIRAALEEALKILNR